MIPTHAGGVVASRRGDEPVFLIVRASRPPFEWVLPKGHVENGETPEQAARREVLEETGVDTEVVQEIGDVAFVVDGNNVRVRYFLLRMRQAGLKSEPRDNCWCSLADAEQLLAFASAKDIVRRAAKFAAQRKLGESFGRGSA